MGETFTSLWAESLSNIVFNVAISSDGNTIVASSGASVSVFDGGGRLVWTAETSGDCLSVSVSHDGQLIAVSSSFGGVLLYDREGRQLRQLTPERAVSVSLAGDASCVGMAMTEDVVVMMPINRNGQSWACSSPEPTVVATNEDGSRVAVGGARGDISLHGQRGELLSHFAAEGCFYGLAVDASASFIAAAPSNKAALYFLSTDGTVKWAKQLTNPSQRVAISDGGDVVACADLHHVRLLTRDGSELMTAAFTDRLYAVALTPDASRLVVGGNAGLKYLQTWLSLELASKSASDGISPKTIFNIRSRYLNFPPEGLCRWFNAFDKCLSEEKYAACDALLEEIDSGGYEMDLTEAEYVTSRRGALALSRGITHEFRKEFDEADRHYRIALQFHLSCRNSEGEGQVRALLERSGDQSQREVIAQVFKEQLKVLGGGEACLTHRISDASSAELLNLIYSAKEAGHMEPLFTAINSDRHDHFNSAANASAALVYLQPGPGITEILGLLNHPSWFVRWRACSLILRFSSTHGPTREIETAITVALQQETDPTVRCELLRLIADGVGNVVTEDLLSLLDDPEADVRFLTCKVLAKFGTRNGLSALANVKEGRTSFGDYVGNAVNEAVEEIDKRQPELEIESIHLYSFHMANLQEASRFLANEPVINGAIHVRNFQPGVYVRLSQEVIDRSLRLLYFYSEYPAESEPELTNEFLEIDSEDWGSDRFSFELQSPSEGWHPGQNTLFIYLNNQFIIEHSFEVVTSITFNHCLLSTTIDSADVLNSPSRVVAGNVPHMYCQVVIDNGTVGMPLEVRVFNNKGNVLRKDRRLAETEGIQRILFQWVAGFDPGTYTVHVDSGGLGEHLCHFEVIESVKIGDARMYRDVDWAGVARFPVSSYQPYDDFILAVEMFVMTGATISGELRWRNQSVFSAPVTCSTRSSGEQIGTLVFRKPTSGWPVGDYDLAISADNVSVRNISFQVVPVPLSQKVRALANDAGELVRYEGKTIIRSALGWGVKLPILVITLFLMDAVLARVAGPEVVESAWLLAFASKIGASGWISSLVVGVVFGAFQGVSKEHLPEKVYRATPLFLIFVFQSLFGQQAAYIIFGLGYLFPKALGQVFSMILFAAPIVAWLVVLSGFRFLSSTYLSAEVSLSFVREAIATSALSLTVYLSGLIGSLLMGIVGGIILWPFGWVSVGWYIGVYAGFFIGVMTMVAIMLTLSRAN